MSIKLMAAAWEMDLPQTEKMVLLCLCDHSSDEGVCWPSVARMARKCSVSDRTVQTAIKRLRERGIIDWNEAPGRSHKFTIDPRRIFTPENASPPKMTTEPPKMLRGTPENASPKPSITVKEPSKNNKARKPDCVSSEVWDDFQSLRKAKRSPLTPTALKRIEAEAAKAGWSMEDALSESVSRGWQSFKAEWVLKGPANDRQQPSNSNTYALTQAKLAGLQ